MRIAHCLAIAAMLLCLPTLVDADEPREIRGVTTLGCWNSRQADRVEKALDTYFAADANSRSAIYRETLVDLPIGLSREDLRRIASAKPPEGKKGPDGTTRMPLPWDPNNPRAWVNVRLPNNYTPTRAWPVAVCLHGSDADGDNVTAFYLPQLSKAGFITLYPTTLDKSHMWSHTDEITNVHRILSWAGRRWRVDYRRLVVTGASMGGMGAWYHMLADPHIWSAGTSVSGHPAAMKGPVLQNLQGKPFYLLHGEKDTGQTLSPVENVRTVCDRLRRRWIQVTLMEVRGVDHNIPRLWWRPMNRWIARQGRLSHSPRPMFLPDRGDPPIWRIRLDGLGLGGRADPAWWCIQAGQVESAIYFLDLDRKRLQDPNFPFNAKIPRSSSPAQRSLLWAAARLPGLTREFPRSLRIAEFSNSAGWSIDGQRQALVHLKEALVQAGEGNTVPNRFIASVHVQIAKIHACRLAAALEKKGTGWLRHYNAAVAALRAALRSKPGYRDALRLAKALRTRLPELPRRGR